MQDFDPEQWIARCRQGDREALGTLLEQYRNYFTLLARIQIGRHLQRKADAADVVQDTFLEAHRAWSGFSGTSESTFLAWMRKLLAGQLAHLIRRFVGVQARRIDLEQSLEVGLDESSGRLARGLADSGPSPSESAARRERAALVADALARLPKDYREVIEGRQLHGLAFAEIAERLGRSVDSVQKLWVRGLEQLQRELAEIDLS